MHLRHVSRAPSIDTAKGYGKGYGRSQGKGRGGYERGEVRWEEQRNEGYDGVQQG